MTPGRSPAYLMVGIGIVLTAGLSGSIGCASVKTDNGIDQDAAAGQGGSTGAAGASDGGLGGFTAGGTGGASSGAGGFSFPDAGADAPGDASVGCRLSIVPVAPPSFTGVEAGPGARMRVQGTVSGAYTPPVTWQWTVNFVSSLAPSAPITPAAIDMTGALVEFPIEVVGRYQIVAQLAGQPACHTLQVIDTVAPGPTTYVLRATATGFPVQDQRIMLATTDAQQLPDWQLQTGVVANLSPQRADLNGGSLASYVRITDPVSTLSIDGDSTKGPVVTPLLPVAYDVLIVPSEPYAPDLFHGTPGSPSWPPPLQLDHGVMVTATAVDGGGKAVAGAHLVLRRESPPMTLPSTVGVSDGNGVATLWARAGTLAAHIEPPAGSGLPSAAVGVGSDPGIVLVSGASSLALSMTWDRVTSAALSIHVLGPSGAPVGAGARVRATSQAAPARVGQLIARPAGGSAVTFQATGSTDVEVVTDTSSTAAFTLPVGGYVVTVVPASTSGAPSASTPAITATTVMLAAGGLSRDVTLATKSTISGMLLPVTDSPGTQVTAIDRSATAPGAVVSAIVGANGAYQLFVDPGHSYELLAQPAAGVSRGRAILSSSVSDATPTVATATLPTVHPMSGKILGTNGGGAGGVLMQVFCPSTSTKCLDATFPLGEAVTRADGSFALLLPDPGN